MKNKDKTAYKNLSYIIAAVFRTFEKEDKNTHIFYMMRELFIQNITVPSKKSNYV